MNRRRLASHQYPNTHPGARRRRLVTLQEAPESTTTPVIGIAPLIKRAVQENTKGGSPRASCSRKRTASITPAGSTTAAATAPLSADTALTVQRTLWTVATDTADHQTDAMVIPLTTDTALHTAHLTVHLTAPLTATILPTATGTTPPPDDTATPQTPTAGTPLRTGTGEPLMRNPMGKS